MQPPPLRASRWACAGLLAGCLARAAAASAAADHVFVVTTDFVSQGNCAALELLPPWTAAVDLEQVGVRPAVRHFAGLHYVVNASPGDNLQIIEPATFATIRTIPFAAGADPRDVWAVGDGTAFVSFYDRAELLRVDLVSGATVAAIDLAAFADADGLPEMACMARDGNHLFVQLQRLDRTQSPVDLPGLLAVVNIPTNTLVDADPATPGTQAIALAWSRPQFPMQTVGRRLYLAEPGAFYDQAGGIEAIDLDTLAPLGLVFTEKGMGLGHMGGFVFVSETRGYVLHHTDLLQSSHLVSFSRTTGSFIAEHFVSFGLTETVGFDRHSNLLYFPDSEPSAAGVRVFDAATGTQLTPAPISTGLAPIDCVVARDIATSVGPADFELRPAPNPTRGETTVAWAPQAGLVRLVIFDARGRRVRTLAAPNGTSGLDSRVRWNCRDDAGRDVPAGVYFLHLEAFGARAATPTAAGRVHVVR